jgi:signal transduction histidine kinase
MLIDHSVNCKCLDGVGVPRYARRRVANVIRDASSGPDYAAIIAMLGSVPLFASCSQHQLAQIANGGATVQFGPNCRLFTQGEPGDALYVILNGSVRVHTQDDAGNQVDLRTLSSRDSFGEVAVLDGGPRSASVSTMTTCEFFVLGRDAFVELLPRSPGLLVAVLKNLTATVRATTQRIVEEDTKQRLIRTEMELERYRSVAQMVAGVAHEINTPLGIVNTAAGIVKKHAMSEALAALTADPGTRTILDDLGEAADLIERNIRRAHQLVQDFNKLSVGEIADTLETLDLVDTLREIVGLYSIAARKAGLEVSIHNDVADGSAATWVGYRGCLSQVILNLLTNAERYAYPEGRGGVVQIRVTEAQHPRGPSFVVCVRDFGLGIASDALPRVFDPFYTTGRTSGGTGLGMAIVHHMVTSALDGSIELTSTPGKGTRVCLTFPKVIRQA